MAGANRWCLGTFGHYRPNAWWLDYAEHILALGLLRKLAYRYCCNAGADLPDANIARKGQAGLNRLHWRCLVGTWYCTSVARLYMGRNSVRLAIAADYRPIRRCSGCANSLYGLRSLAGATWRAADY